MLYHFYFYFSDCRLVVQPAPTPSYRSNGGIIILPVRIPPGSKIRVGSVQGTVKMVHGRELNHYHAKLQSYCFLLDTSMYSTCLALC
jgi:hypothetical protein